MASRGSVFWGASDLYFRRFNLHLSRVCFSQHQIHRPPAGKIEALFACVANAVRVIDDPEVFSGDAGRVLVAAWRAKDPFGTLFGAGLASMILFQLVVNVGMVLGIMPITGIPLPFVTHGGASLVSMAAGLGILQSVNIRQTRAAW